MNQEAPKKSKHFSILKLAVMIAAGLLVYIFFYPYYSAFTQTNYTFGFGDVNGQENKGIEILDYRFDKLTPIKPADWQLKEGRIPQFNRIGTSELPGETLYVKWRVLATGKEYEDTVNLKGRLPEDMNKKIIHFIIENEKLNVYVISKHGHTLGGVECPARQYRDYGCDRIYPDYWKNY